MLIRVHLWLFFNPASASAATRGCSLLYLTPGLIGLICSFIKTVNVHKAKTQFSRLLAAIEKRGERIVISRNGKPVADLVPHQTMVPMGADKKLGRIAIHYHPTEEATEAEWPTAAR